MAERWTRRHAVHQALAVAVIIAAGVAIALPHVRAPHGAGALKGEVSALRSQAAEAALVAEASERLTARFLEAHLRQLADDADGERERIAALSVNTNLEADRRRALDAASRLHGLLIDARGGHDASLAGAKAIVRDMQSLEGALDR